ncbi:MAG: hypothetical protein IPH44_14040 [Myxococcales bacterium]|nr:hypothetical protein [Myxococcales bacterium]MBK7192492.1 hypothetical protein [Myxococcales bacterium]MBP6846300.1 hypothetical protein [Kofleriaceae bacterium]
MRAFAFVALLSLAGLSLAVGAFHLAVALAAVKAVVVGLVYMDLRHAHRAHAVGFVLGVALLIAVLAVVGG